MIFLLQAKSVRNLCSLKFIDLMKKNILIEMLYCPPDQNVQDFVGSVDRSVYKIWRGNKNSYLKGDFIFNLWTHNSHATTDEFLDVMLSR